MEEPDQLSKMGQAGLQFVQQFEMTKVLETFEKELIAVVREAQAGKKTRKEDSESEEAGV